MEMYSFRSSIFLNMTIVTIFRLRGCKVRLEFNIFVILQTFLVIVLIVNFYQMSGDTKKRVLIIANELSPYLEFTDFAQILNKLAIKTFDSGIEVRVIMPRFGTINERRHRLHEVVRLSGINIIIDKDDYPLIIKVASLPNARLQVYFMDNEDYFKRKSVFRDDQDNFHDD